MAWQTKVTDPPDNRRQMPMIAPKIYVSGEPWWEVFETGTTTLVEFMGHRDWLMPAPSKDHKSVRQHRSRTDKKLRGTANTS